MSSTVTDGLPRGARGRRARARAQAGCGLIEHHQSVMAHADWIIDRRSA